METLTFVLAIIGAATLIALAAGCLILLYNPRSEERRVLRDIEQKELWRIGRER